MPMTTTITDCNNTSTSSSSTSSSSSSSKRSRTMVTETAFDVRLHTLVPYSPTVGCVRITTPNLTAPPTKDDTISLVVIADASGSMESGSRIDDLRAGIMRLGELSGQFASMNVELTVIRFSDEASIVWGPAPVPNEERLRQLCMDIKPRGGTNMCKAIELALNVAEDRSLGNNKSVHIVFFTDGVDTSFLQTKLENDATTPFLDKLKSLKRLTFHCVGICADADAPLLDTLARTACRGTFQCIKENNIAKLIGCMWALMMEMVDDNVRLVVEAIDTEGVARAMVSRDVILRVCETPLVVGFKVPQLSFTLRARLAIDDRCLETRISLPREDSPAFDMVCAQEAVNQLQGELSEKIVALLRAGNPADAVLEVGVTRQVIQALLEKADTDEQRAEFSIIVDAAMLELDTSEADLLRALSDFEEARDAELRAMSRSATVRNSGVSILPDGRSLSALQRQLSSGA